MPDGITKLENSRVRIREVIHRPGERRESYVRETDQVVVFLDTCRYERIDADTGESILRYRKAGDVLFHKRGEHAPALVNAGTEPYRAIVIEIKS